MNKNKVLQHIVPTTTGLALVYNVTDVTDVTDVTAVSNITKNCQK